MMNSATSKTYLKYPLIQKVPNLRSCPKFGSRGPEAGLVEMFGFFFKVKI